MGKEPEVNLSPATLMTLPLVHWSDMSQSITFKTKHKFILDVTPATEKGAQGLRRPEFGDNIDNMLGIAL